MTKIPFEDRTQPLSNEQKFKAFCATSNLFLVSKALEMGFTIRDVAVAIFKMGEDVINFAKISGDIKEDDYDKIKKEAAELAGEKLKEVEIDGIADIIRKYVKK